MGSRRLPVTPNPPYGRLNSHPRLESSRGRSRQAVLTAGSRASDRSEPGQVGNEAALSFKALRRGVTWPEPATGDTPGA